MRFRYAYKSSDGERHEEEMSADSREAVFEELRRKGIRAIKVVACDGSKANGAVQPARGRRWLALSALVGAVVATAAFMFIDRIGRMGGDGDRQAEGAYPKAGERVAKPRTRHQIGLNALTNEVPLASIFAHPSEVLLAQFAEPGQSVFVDVGGDVELAEDFKDALDAPIVILPQDSLEVAELKRIVAGIKEEARMMIASGKTFEEAVAYFVAQQQMEARYREVILLQDASTEDKNRQLSALGLCTIANPKEQE